MHFSVLLAMTSCKQKHTEIDNADLASHCCRRLPYYVSLCVHFTVKYAVPYFRNTIVRLNISSWVKTVTQLCIRAKFLIHALSFQNHWNLLIGRFCKFKLQILVFEYYWMFILSFEFYVYDNERHICYLQMTRALTKSEVCVFTIK